MDKGTRNRIQAATQKARALLEAEFTAQLEGVFDVRADGTLGEAADYLSGAQSVIREKIIAAIESERAKGVPSDAAVTAYIRETSFTTLNRFVALKMLEARDLLLECISSEQQSSGFKEFAQLGLADGLMQTEDHGYRLYLESLFDELGLEIGVLFDRRNVSCLLWPRRACMLQLLALINEDVLSKVWAVDETLGWFFQFFSSTDERRAMKDVSRGGSQAPRSSWELATRNQFFTPKFVVEFLTQNTLGRLWCQMRSGDTRVTGSFEFFAAPITEPRDGAVGNSALRDHPYRQAVDTVGPALKDPRDIRVLDPACGSGHFLLCAYDVLADIYAEAWQEGGPTALSSASGESLREDYPEWADLQAALPGLILEHNLYGIDIDARCVQIAALALWMRAQRAFSEARIPRGSRLAIRRTHLVVAEPMPGDGATRRDFLSSLEPRLAKLMEHVFSVMEIAGEAGSLLAIEEAVSTAIRELYGETGGLFSEQDQARWDEAERALIHALAEYSERLSGATNRPRRQLFSRDAASGLAFVDIARQRYDVVLMNPPFGEPTESTREYVLGHYPNSRLDCAMAFVERGLSMVNDSGFVGAITTRTVLLLARAAKWRHEVLRDGDRLQYVADLGYGVLDATVETAAYVLSRPVSNASVWCRLVNVPDKASALSGCLKALNQGAASEDVFMVPSGYFSSFPGAPFAYWAPSTIIDIFRELPPFQQGGRIVRCGMGTLDDFRFLRTWWEVPASGLAESRQETEQGRTWVAFAKPGEAAPFASDTKLVVNWGSNGRELKTYVESRVGSASRKVQSESLYFRSGLQFGRRVRRFSPAILPPGQIFSDSANAVFVDDESDLLAYLALLSGSPVRLLWSLFAPLRKMEVGYLQRLPVPIVDSDDEELVALARAGVRDALYRLQSDETSRYFNPGVLSQELPSALLDRSRLDEIVASKYGLDSTTLGILAANAEAQPAVDDGPNPWGLDKHTIVSLRVGSAFGRFDLGSERTCEPDISLLERPAPRPGALRPQVDENAQHDYREAMVLDAGHPLDIAAVVACPPHSGGDPQDASKHDVLFTSTDVLVGDYLSRKFFQEHIKRYAVGARRAPVYWQLSTVSSSYSVWLYYHTVSRDSLFRLLNDFILPKLHHEERQLHRLAQEAESGRTFVQRTEIDAQRTLIDELSVFRDEVERVAPLWDPDLNDGVLVNFAPLWRLVPHVRPWQREAKDCWSKLTRGEYDWAHLAMHLWPERVVPKCAEDRSLAIAHGLEDTFWVERDDGKWAQREVDAATVERLVQERSSAAVKAALADLLAAG